MILIISFISSFKMNKVNHFPVLVAFFQLTFLWNLSKIDEVALFANLGKTSLAKGTARSNKPFFA